jgi:hypothetical protein
MVVSLTDDTPASRGGVKALEIFRLLAPIITKRFVALTERGH